MSAADRVKLVRSTSLTRVSAPANDNRPTFTIARTPDDPDFDPVNAFLQYEHWLNVALDYHRRGKLDAAVTYGGIAAMMATRPHAGFYVSPRLERMFADIGRRTAKPTTYRRKSGVKIKHILHVASEALPVGGHTNMITRWINEDKSRVHSLALIHQHLPVPEATLKAVSDSGGKIYRINRTPGYQVAWAEELRRIARLHDGLMLHVFGQDPVASVAFAEPDKLPPIMLLNHGDHLFWLGASTTDVVINLRDAAQDLSISRRSIEPKRNVMVPTMVSPASRTRTREEAKKQLGIPPDTLLLFSAARSMKYRTFNGVPYSRPHVDLLKRHPNAQLWVLGAGSLDSLDDWQADIAATGGRIKAIPETPDTKIYYEAADIYVDSFPFVSSTSLMEAAGLGTPLVSRFYGSKAARIFAINHPGIDKPTLHGWTEAEYVANLERLITDPALREAKAKEARESVLYYHTPPSWNQFIERAYKLAEELPPIDTAKHFSANDREEFFNGEPDRLIYEIFGYNEDNPVRILRWYTGLLPTGERLKLWNKLRKHGAFDNWKQAIRLLAPNWLMRRLLDR